MVYAQFYDYDLSGQLNETCGSDSVLILDGRVNRTNQLGIIFKYCHQLKNIRTFKAFRIMKGDSFTRSQPISNLIHL